VILDIAADLQSLAPGALLVNFTNPAGLITEALQRHVPLVSSVGVCNVPITAKMMLLNQLEIMLGISISPERTQLDTLGLNHLSWHRGFALDGEDVWPRLLEATLAALKASPDPEWDPDLIQSLGMIPNYYLGYYYDTPHKLAAQDAWPPSRAEQVMQVERELLERYADPSLLEPPPELMQRGGAYYSTMATRLLSAHFNDLGETHVVNTTHAGAVPEWPSDWVLELPCRVDRRGIHPLPARSLPPDCFRLVEQVKAYELLTIEAAVHGDRDAARRALLAHPLGPSPDQVDALLDDLLLTHRNHLPLF
jgi:6-phospho-beta-glucosidase